ncbi:hypothetical protein BH11MYX2_BH11MYX2_05820 [soil metagenome]
MTESVVPVDPAVRSVRIAAALCDRFEELMRGPTQIRATRNRRSLVGVTGDETGMSLRLGEAQQLYPEIWRHLDDARTAFAARGTDVAGYDGLRKQEGAGMGANVHTSEGSYGAGRYAYDEYTKTADFNVAGLSRARQTIAVLVSITPQIDWASIVAAEHADPAVAEFTRGTRRKRIIQLSLLAAVVLSPFIIVQYMHHRDRVQRDEWRERNVAEQASFAAPSLTATEVAALDANAKIVRRNVDKAREGWPDSDDIAAAVPTAKMCPLRVTPPRATSAREYVTTGDAEEAELTPSEFYASGKGAVIDDEPVRKADRSLRLIEERIASKTVVAGDDRLLARIVQRANIIIFDELVQPDGPQLGHAKGRTYLFDFAAGKVVCAGTFDVTNDINDPLAEARKMPHRSVWTDMLRRELEVRMRMAFGSDLHAL